MISDAGIPSRAGSKAEATPMAMIASPATRR